MNYRNERRCLLCSFFSHDTKTCQNPDSINYRYFTIDGCDNYYAGNDASSFWHSVNDSLPDDEDIVLVYYQTPHHKMYVIAKFHHCMDHNWWTLVSPNYVLDGYTLNKPWVTHWTPLPPSP